MELDCGITVYPPEMEGEPWRAVFTENGQRRYRQAATEAKLVAKLEKVRERLEVDAPNLERPGADLIAYYLDPDRLPPDRRWSRKHAHTQRRLCERFAAPAIGMVMCQDIRPWHMQQIVNAAPTAGEGVRVAGMISALVSAGIVGGYLASPTGRGEWTWHSLRHVFCTTASLFTWGLDAADVSRMAGHANVRITLDMYVGAVVGVLDRARQATA